MNKAKILFRTDKMTIFQKSNMYVFNFKDIIGFFCDHPYVKIETTTSKPILIFHSLKEIGQLLPPPFIVCNRSSIINITHIHQVKSTVSKCVLPLVNGREIRVARRRKSNVMKQIYAIIRKT